jgi:hypothetical protein
MHGSRHVCMYVVEWGSMGMHALVLFWEVWKRYNVDPGDRVQLCNYCIRLIG